MTDISVIILTGKEEIHIRRCLEKLAPLGPKQVFVVESQKGDRTHEIAIEVAKQLQWQVKGESEGGLGGLDGLGGLGGERTALHLVWHDWPGLQSTQFNWALDNLPIAGTWVLRLDADEYLTPETIAKLKDCFSGETYARLAKHCVSPKGKRHPENVSGLNLELKRLFCGGEIRHATNGIRQMRIFRYGIGRCEQCEMDERINIAYGETVDFDGAFYDENLNDMDWWREKHRGYAKREAQQAIECMRTGVWIDSRKATYYKIPRYARALIYFGVRYFLLGGFLDGYAGWMWNFWQGLWYRCRVDYEISKILAKQSISSGDERTGQEAELNRGATCSQKSETMTDISVIILVGKEEVHIRRCLEKLAPLGPKQVFVVESQKGDRTHEIAIEVAKQLQWQVKGEGLGGLGGLGGERTALHLVWHDWPGLYAKQFNWALDNLPIEGTWVLRLDADEYLTEETIKSLRSRLEAEAGNGGFPPEVSGLNIELKRRFCGGEIRHATVGLLQARIFRYGCGRCEERAMDEHIYVTRGEIVRFDGAFYDDNLNDMGWWREKHHGYAKREARDALAFARGELQFKPRKAAYYRYPRYLRAFAYFGFRYFVKKGILDGYTGWMWNFWQGLWYRCLVDYEIGKLKKAGGC